MKTINDTVLEQQIFDRNKNLIFEKHNQIDFGKNSIIYISLFKYDSTKNCKTEYHANSNLGLKYKLELTDINQMLSMESQKSFGFNNEGFFSKTKDFQDRASFRQQLFNINSFKEFNEFFVQAFPKNFEPDFTYNYSGSIITKTISYVKNDTIITEILKTRDGFVLENTKNYYGKDKKKLKEYRKETDNWILFQYDINGNLILKKEPNQFRRYFYNSKSQLKKEELYHDNVLAFKSEYFYNGNLIYREIKYRITQSEYFKEIPEKSVVNYRYEYY